jgi:hypothetical protein
MYGLIATSERDTLFPPRVLARCGLSARPLRKERFMPETAKHSGSCHCGAVRFEAETDLAKVLACNCSFCQKRGALWTYLTGDQFKLLSGEDDLSDYQFNKKIIHHVFCRHCGVGAFSTATLEGGVEGIGINVRCLDDVDVGALELTPYDGKSR